jgi:molybdopterin-guanine dinucleotide biosynthesis protein A
VTGTLGVSAIVLAGGRSSRFGRDKLAEPVDGRPLLEHAIDAVRSLADEVVVVVSRSATPSLPAGIVVAHDAWDFGGPLVGLVTGVKAASGSRCLVVGGDMPTLRPTVLAALLAALDDRVADAALLEHGNDVPPLPMAIRRSAAIGPLQQATAAGERRLRAVRELLATTIMAEAEWRRLDPYAATLTDVDTPADLL